MGVSVRAGQRSSNTNRLRAPGQRWTSGVASPPALDKGGSGGLSPPPPPPLSRAP